MGESAESIADLYREHTRLGEPSDELVAQLLALLEPGEAVLFACGWTEMSESNRTSDASPPARTPSPAATQAQRVTTTTPDRRIAAGNGRGRPPPGPGRPSRQPRPRGGGHTGCAACSC